MRILLKLKAIRECEYDNKYYHKLQGFVYGLLKDTEYRVLHNKKGYKFFCFSNIFPRGNIKAGDVRNLIISSPDTYFIKLIEKKVNEFIDKGQTILIGEMAFRIENYKVFEIKLKKRHLSIVSSTPIIIRIPEKNYEKYGIEDKKRRYVYWRPKYGLESFLAQIQSNLFKKYKEFYKEDIEEFPIFEILQMLNKNPVVVSVIIDGKEYKVTGSLWRFEFMHLEGRKKRILQFGIDAGFGERNSLGFGFMNVEYREK